jgi:predicted Ser/Thr protein kinase
MFIGQKVGPFLIDKELGSGAMGTVYRARFDNKGKITAVALKVISLGLLGNDSAMARFERESAILKQLRHPHIVRLLATGTYRKTPFIAMEYVDGEPMDRALSRRGRLSWEEVFGYAKQLCEALQHAHDKGIIHRDLKPSNLMITKEGVLKLTDFGIAKDTDVTALTGQNSTIGTAAYMSPEQCRGEKSLSAKSDLYSLGVCFYELITGRKPFVADTTMDMFLKHVNEPPVRPTKYIPDLPVWVDNLIMFLMEKKVEMRPLDANTVAKMIADIEQKVQDQQSAGVEAANARRIDRKMNDASMDHGDREAAKLLRGGKKKKKKAKVVPFAEKKWPKALGLGLVLAALIGVGIWLAWPEPLPKAYAKVEAAAPDERLDAVAGFLKKHGAKSDPSVDKAKGLFGELIVKEGEKQLTNRHQKGFTKLQDDEDKEVMDNIWAAFEAENDGNLKRAGDCWKVVQEKSAPLDPEKYSDKTNASRIALKAIAEKRIADLQSVPKKLADLKGKIAVAKGTETLPSLEPTDPERQALRAVWLQQFGDPLKARREWDALAKDTAKNLPQHLWHIAAAEQRNLIVIDKGGESSLEKARKDRVAKALEDSVARWEQVKDDPEARVAKRDIRAEWFEIKTLYDDDPTEEIKAIVERAKKLLETTPKPMG